MMINRIMCTSKILTELCFTKQNADFECNLRSVASYERSYTKKCQDHIPCSFAEKVVCVNVKFTKSIVVYRGENAAYEFLKQFLRSSNVMQKSNGQTL